MKPYDSHERNAKYHHGVPNLRVLRQRKGLSIGQLADMTGLRRETISHFENGREENQHYHLRILERFLVVPQIDLVSYKPIVFPYIFKYIIIYRSVN